LRGTSEKTSRLNHMKSDNYIINLAIFLKFPANSKKIHLRTVEINTIGPKS
jgi:hypothetical protein